MGNIINITDQFYTSANGPIDSKLTPLGTYESLTDMANIPRKHRYIGLTITVLNTDNGGQPCDYWLVGGTTNASWKIKAGNVIDTYEHLQMISPSACTIGLEMNVQNDETNSNSLSKYWVTNISYSGSTPTSVTWTRKVYGTEVMETVENTVEMLMDKRFGNVVYTTNKIYSYENTSGDTVWTADVTTIPEDTEYNTYDNGLYAIKEDSDGNVSFEEVQTGENSSVSVDGTDMESTE